MKVKLDAAQRISAALEILPPRIGAVVRALPRLALDNAEELHLRCGQRGMLYSADREYALAGDVIHMEELRDLISRAARYSVHSFEADLACGFLPLEGGHRLGVCGTVSRSSGHVTGYRSVSSVNLRFAQEHTDAAAQVEQTIITPFGVRSTLIVAPPGFGKTTLLRDLIRRCACAGWSVGVADERGELAALREAVPQFDLGDRTDVIDGLSKAEGAMRLIRTMNPRVLAMDEITEERDLAAIRQACHCGVSVLATAHGTGHSDLMKKPLFRELFAAKVFDCVLALTMRDGIRIAEEEKIPC